MIRTGHQAQPVVRELVLPLHFPLQMEDCLRVDYNPGKVYPFKLHFRLILIFNQVYISISLRSLTVIDINGNDVTDDDVDSDPDDDDTNDPPGEDDIDDAPICVIPVPVIIGDAFVCPGDTSVYSVVSFNPANTYTWALINGGGVIIANNDSNIVVVWQADPGGPFTVSVTESAGGACVGVGFLVVWIQGDEILTCNDHIQISIDEDCESVVLSGMILEGEVFGDDNYIVIIIDENGDTIPNATLTAEHVGQTFTVKVLSECSGNSCWGTISVEDKLPPHYYLRMSPGWNRTF